MTPITNLFLAISRGDITPLIHHRKTNMDTQNDSLEKVNSSKYGHVWYTRATKKKLLLSIEPWLFNRDPKIIAILRCTCFFSAIPRRPYLHA